MVVITLGSIFDAIFYAILLVMLVSYIHIVVVKLEEEESLPVAGQGGAGTSDGVQLRRRTHLAVAFDALVEWGAWIGLMVLVSSIAIAFALFSELAR